MLSPFPTGFIVSRAAPLLPTNAVAGNGTFADTDGTGLAASIAGPMHMHFHSGSNTLYFSTLGNRIRKMTVPGYVVSTLTAEAGNVSIQGVTVDASNTNVYYTLYNFDTSTYTVRTVPTSGGSSSLIAGSIEGYVNATGASARFSRPSGIVINGAGNLIVSDAIPPSGGNRRIRQVTPGGVVTLYSGTGVADTIDSVGDLTSAAYQGPGPMWVDPSGNIYVGDLGNGSRIRLINPTAVTVTTFAGGPFYQVVNSSNPLTAKFQSITGITQTPAGDMYIVDTDRIRKISTGGVVTTVTEVQSMQQVVAVSNTTLYVSSPSTRTIRIISLV